MHTFTHVTRYATDQKDAAGKVIQASVSETLTVPTTLAELVSLTGAEVEIMVGVGADGKEVRIKVPEPCADYIRGRKLRSNQEQQAAARGDGGKVAARAAVASWYGSQGAEKLSDLFQRMSAANTPAKLKEHNGWLDKLYADNRAAIDGK